MSVIQKPNKNEAAPNADEGKIPTTKKRQEQQYSNHQLMCVFL